MDNWVGLLLTALLLIIAFIIGLLIGWLAKRMFAPEPVEAAKPAESSASTNAAAAAPAAAATSASAAPSSAGIDTVSTAKPADAAPAAPKEAPKQAPEQARKKPAPKKAAPKKAAPKSSSAQASSAKSSTAKSRAAKSSAAKPADSGDKGRPTALSAPRDGQADDLKQISGVGPKLEEKLNSLGIYHFDQIAAWKKAEVDWVDNYLSFKGRITRDKWIAQAKKLAK